MAFVFVDSVKPRKFGARRASLSASDVDLLLDASVGSTISTLFDDRRSSQSPPSSHPSSIVSVRSPFEVDFLFRDGQRTQGGHVTYSVRVRGPKGERVLHPRYSCFVELRKKLMRDAAKNALPQLPPKAVLRKRFCMTGAAFMAEREKGLRRFVKAAAAMDPAAENPAWRSFVGIARQDDRRLSWLGVETQNLRLVCNAASTRL